MRERKGKQWIARLCFSHKISVLVKKQSQEMEPQVECSADTKNQCL